MLSQAGEACYSGHALTVFMCMLQVLDTILHADRLLFQQLRSLADAAVVVHLSSHLTVSSRQLIWVLRTTAGTTIHITVQIYQDCL